MRRVGPWAIASVWLASSLACGGGASEGAPAPDAAADAAPLDAADAQAPVDAADEGGLTLSPTPHGAYLWQGLEHEWLRTVVGFRVPHRVSRLGSAIDGEAFEAPQDAPWSSRATFRFGQDTGVDGNYMKPVGHFAALFHEQLWVDRGEVRFTGTDDGDGAAYPKAKTSLAGAIELDLRYPADAAVAVLRGVRLETACDPAKQPSGEPCNSDGMWPYKLELRLGACVVAGTRVTCPVSVKIERAWTPNLGGLPPLEQKPFNDRLDYSVALSYSVLSGPAAALKVTRGGVASSGKGRDDAPKTGTVTLAGAGAGAYPHGLVAMTGFGFELSKSEAGDKYQHLGRYLGALRFRVRDVGYDAAKGEATFEHTEQVWLPDTVEDTAVAYAMDVAMLQLGPGSGVSTGGRASGSLCANSKSAPFFSAWSQCGDADKGPERVEDSASVTAP